MKQEIDYISDANEDGSKVEILIRKYIFLIFSVAVPNLLLESFIILSYLVEFELGFNVDVLYEFSFQ